MKLSRTSSAALLTVSASCVAAQQPSYESIPYLSIKGQHFFYSNNGSQFIMRGVAYQQPITFNDTMGSSDPMHYLDPLADTVACQRDIPYLKALSTNVIRTYAIDPTKNHDDCMSMLADAGIYVISDLSEPDTSINRNRPTWNVLLYQRYTQVIDVLSKYNNVIGFFAGNEVSNTGDTSSASAFVKAAIRDSKAYIQSQRYRTIGVGYAACDNPLRDQLTEYLNCGGPADNVDFWGYNIDSEHMNLFNDFPVPVFFAEYGCKPDQARMIEDVSTVFGSEKEGPFSGGIVDEYFREADNDGLVTIGSDNSVMPLQGFSDLSSQMASITPSSINSKDYDPASSPTSCPSLVTNTVSDATDSNSVLWLAPATPLPPSPNAALCACEMSQLQCISISGDGSTYQPDIDYTCGIIGGACDGIQSNFSLGAYGSYGMCSDQQKLSYAFNKYYEAQQGAAKSGACDFRGRAHLQPTSSATGPCPSLLQAAGTDGQGMVPQPSGNSQQQASAVDGRVGSVGSSGSGSSSSSGVAAAITVPALDMVLLQTSVYVAVAALTGASMIFL